MGKWICAGFVMAGLMALGCSDDSNGNGSRGGSGGHGGVGGSVANGGGGAAGQGGAVTPATSFAFTSGVDQFMLDMFANVGPYSDGNPQNIGGVPNGAAAPVVDFDAGQGKPADGSLRIKVTFNDFNQTVTVRRAYTSSSTVNLTGKTVTAQIKLDSGTFSGIVHLMALSSPSPPNPGPGFYFGQGESIHLDDHDWHTLTFHMASPEFAATSFTAGDVVQIGVQLASGILSVPPTSTGAAGSGGGNGGSGSGGGGAGNGGAGGMGGGAGGAAGSSGAGNGGAGGGGAAGPAYGAPQSLTIHFDTLEWN